MDGPFGLLINFQATTLGSFIPTVLISSFLERFLEILTFRIMPPKAAVMKTASKAAMKTAVVKQAPKKEAAPAPVAKKVPAPAAKKTAIGMKTAVAKKAEVLVTLGALDAGR